MPSAACLVFLELMVSLVSSKRFGSMDGSQSLWFTGEKTTTSPENPGELRECRRKFSRYFFDLQKMEVKHDHVKDTCFL